MPYQVNASYSQAWETVYKRFLEKAQPASMPAREFTTLETIEQAHAYVINEIDHFRRDCYTDSISSALGSWATDHPESWKIDPENQKVMPRIPVRIFDWGSGPGIASAFFANYYLNYQVELDAITLIDIGAPAIDAGAEILQIMFGERYPHIHKVADDILNVTKENFERR